MPLTEFHEVVRKFHVSLAHMPAYNGLKFNVTSVEKCHNVELENEFHGSYRYFYEQRYLGDKPIQTVYHGTRPENIPLILKNNFDVDKKGKTDDGWFGAGIYFSQHADYVMMYYTTGSFNLVQVGDKGKLLQVDILPGRIKRLDQAHLGAARTINYDSHVTPNGFEYVMFNKRHILPRYVISFDVVAAAGTTFKGSVEQLGVGYTGTVAVGTIPNITSSSSSASNIKHSSS